MKISVENTGAVVELLTLAEIKEWCIIDHDQDDNILMRIYGAVKRSIEARTKILLHPCVVTVLAEMHNNLFYLPRLPYVGINTISIWENNAWSVLPGTDYIVQDDEVSILMHRYGRVKFVYTGGYDEITLASQDDLKIAALNEIAYRYENRGDQEQIKGLTETTKQYLTPYMNMHYFI